MIFQKLKLINSALLNNEKVQLAINSKYNFIWEDLDIKKSYKKVNKSFRIIYKYQTVQYTINLKPKK